MIASMTGFGRGRAQNDTLALVVEIRSVNSRYCEISSRMPRQLAEYENAVQNQVKLSISRGRISISVQPETAGDVAMPVRIDPVQVRGYTQVLKTLAREAGIDEPVSLSHLLNFPDLITTVEETLAPGDATRDLLIAATEEAIQQLSAMRLQEGEALRQDLAMRLNLIEERLREVETRAPERIAEARARMTERLAELFSDDRVDRDRLEMEIVMLSDRLDVTEECVRLASHVQMFREAMTSDEPVGRKLNFIVQEINREVNTIGSKANDARVAHLAVEMKEELEKIREQVQNIE
ncbi:MAG: YicC/YloC family endoribonuclease [Rhodothermales bacterium]